MYQVSQGVFVDGAVADAEDFLNEFGAVAAELNNLNTLVKTEDIKGVNTSKDYTDKQLAALVVDGGTF